MREKEALALLELRVLVGIELITDPRRVSNPLLGTDPGIINTDPYGEGWYMKIMPSDWEADSADLVTGAEGIAAYEAFLVAEGIECE